MSAEANTLLPRGELRSTRPGDLPERLRARYFIEDHGREQRLFVDATGLRPLIEDRGRQLLARNADPNAVRDLVAIAAHRGWQGVDVRGSAAFRREAWLEARARGLEVRGHRPTARDEQALARRDPDRPRSRREAPQAADRLRVIETVLRHRAADPDVEAQLLARARTRIADWLERGARFEPLRDRPDHGERRRGR